MLPNDAIVSNVARELLANSTKPICHISCSTISPVTSRELAKVYSEANGSLFIASPVFARPDGIARRQATWMVSGDAKGREVAEKILHPLGNVVDYGDDVGSANVVKLCGNFLIAVRQPETTATALNIY